MRYPLVELGFKQVKSASVNEDNTACCISWATEITVTLGRIATSAHKLYHYYKYAKEQVHQKGEIEVKYINTSEQVGDISRRPAIRSILKPINITISRSIGIPKGRR